MTHLGYVSMPLFTVLSLDYKICISKILVSCEHIFNARNRFECPLTVSDVSEHALPTFIKRHPRLCVLEMNGLNMVDGSYWNSVFHALHDREQPMFLRILGCSSHDYDVVFALESDETGDYEYTSQELHDYLHGRGEWTQQLAEEWTVD